MQIALSCQTGLIGVMAVGDDCQHYFTALWQFQPEAVHRTPDYFPVVNYLVSVELFRTMATRLESGPVSPPHNSLWEAECCVFQWWFLTKKWLRRRESNKVRQPSHHLSVRWDSFLSFTFMSSRDSHQTRSVVILHCVQGSIQVARPSNCALLVGRKTEAVFLPAFVGIAFWHKRCITWEHHKIPVSPPGSWLQVFLFKKKIKINFKKV